MKKSIGAKTIVFPTPVWVIGSYDKNGKANAMTVAWGGICCSQPPAVTISLRKATYSYHCIMERKAYTVNVPSERFIQQADYIGIVSGRDHDKFAETGLTAVKSELVDAPYVLEFPLALECRVIHTLEIGLHTQFIGEIMNVLADEDALNENGLPDMDKVQPMLYAPTVGAYYGSGKHLGKGYDVGKGLKKR
jgi:flavin reductase (DIM6/NTAB) family NADH-FMN oxidoreductase RutF